MNECELLLIKTIDLLSNYFNVNFYKCGGGCCCGGGGVIQRVYAHYVYVSNIYKNHLQKLTTRIKKNTMRTVL